MFLLLQLTFVLLGFVPSAQALSRVVFCQMSRSAPEQLVAEVQEVEALKFKVILYRQEKHWVPLEHFEDVKVVDVPFLDAKDVVPKVLFQNAKLSLKIEKTDARTSSGDLGYSGKLKIPVTLSANSKSVDEDMVCWFSKRAKK